MLVVVIVLNLCPVRVYGETEFWFASLKVFMIPGLLVLSVVLFFGGGPTHQRLGFHYWKYPGPAKGYLVPGAAGRLCGVVYVAFFSVFSFNFAPELLVITAGEMHNPRKNLPKAIKEAGIKGLDSVINAVIITSAWSSASSFLYMSSRSLYSLAVAGNAPQIFTRCSRWGAPYWAVLASCVLGLLAYLNCGNGTSQVFNWLINLTNTAGFTSWICCGITYTRFRMACQAQAVTSLPYRSRFQPYLVWVAMCVFAILLLCNGFSVFVAGNWSVSTFLTSYIGIPVFLGIYFAHRIYARGDSWARHPCSIDLHTGLAEVEADCPEEEKARTWRRRIQTIWD